MAIINLVLKKRGKHFSLSLVSRFQHHPSLQPRPQPLHPLRLHIPEMSIWASLTEFYSIHLQIIIQPKTQAHPCVQIYCPCPLSSFLPSVAWLHKSSLSGSLVSSTKQQMTNICDAQMENRGQVGSPSVHHTGLAYTACLIWSRTHLTCTLPENCCA